MSHSKKRKENGNDILERDADFSLLEEEDESKGPKTLKVRVPSLLDVFSDEPLDTKSGGDNNSVNIGEDSSELESLRAEASELKDKYVRLLAEFDNFRKRTAKERSDLLKYQGESILLDLLEIVDNLERALQHVDSDPAKFNAEKFKEGIDLIFKRFVEVLAKWGVRGESAIAKVFDPTIQQAISTITIKNALANTVFDELKKAYFYKDRLLRPAQVIVAMPEESEGSELPPEDQSGEESDDSSN